MNQQFNGSQLQYSGCSVEQFPDHPQATTILVLGIVGCFMPIIPFVAWYMGYNAKKEIKNGAPYRWGGAIVAGYCLGIVRSILGIIAMVLGLFGIIFYSIAILSVSSFFL